MKKKKKKKIKKNKKEAYTKHWVCAGKSKIWNGYF